MSKTVENLKEDLATVRTGRATPSLIESVKVEVYGSMMNLRDLATILAPEARLLTIQPWDSNNTGLISKALQQSGLGLNPIVEGNFIRLPLPQLTEERRRELIKLVGEKTEDRRIAARQFRREGVEKLDRLEKNAQISEDEKRRGEDQMQKLTDKVMGEIDTISKSKEKELLEI
ncbi:MAG: ribosome recycling factor [Patescibacteria group bacterium]|nr:ribosome recycling factor [Patescibacteria group bacterium]